jgi:hypothetical protein
MVVPAVPAAPAAPAVKVKVFNKHLRPDQAAQTAPQEQIAEPTQAVAETAERVVPAETEDLSVNPVNPVTMVPQAKQARMVTALTDKADLAVRLVNPAA